MSEGPGSGSTSTAAGADGVQERGAFAFGSCARCGWQGPGRRSRERARKDLRHHLEEKPTHADHVAVEDLSVPPGTPR